MNNKGALNIEIIIVLLMLLIIFTFIISITNQEYISITESQNRKEARMITEDISNTIDNVYFQSDGFSSTYQLPDKINNETYIVQINSSGVYVNSHYQLTRSEFIPEYVVDKNTNSKKIVLTPGNTYEFIKNNQTIMIDLK